MIKDIPGIKYIRRENGVMNTMTSTSHQRDQPISFNRRAIKDKPGKVTAKKLAIKKTPNKKIR